jgi:hypothetical protein
VTRRTLLIIRLGVFLAACAFLYLRFREEPLDGLWAQLHANAQHPPTKGLALLLVLMFANWGLEAWKWKWLVAPIVRVPFGRAFVATLAGTTVGLFTPNRVGEFVGRVLFLAPEHRVAASMATILGSIAQFVVTLTVGLLFALPFHRRLSIPDLWYYPTLTLGTVVALSVFVFYFKPELLRRLIALIPGAQRFGKELDLLAGYTQRRLMVALMLSAVRYVVFTAQFVLALELFSEGLVLEAVSAVPVIFLLTTLAPTMLLTELGVRGSVATVVLYGRVATGVLLASTVIWLVNLVIPAIIGSLILLIARIRTSDRSGR